MVVSTGLVGVGLILSIIFTVISDKAYRRLPNYGIARSSLRQPLLSKDEFAMTKSEKRIV